MTRAHTIIVSAFGLHEIINVLVAVILIVALTPEATRIEPDMSADNAFFPGAVTAPSWR